MNDDAIGHNINNLIDSIDWDSLALNRHEKPTLLKEVLIGKHYRSIWLRSKDHKSYLVITQLLLHVLDHPEWHREEQILEQLSWLPWILQWPISQRRNLAEITSRKKTYRLLMQYLPRFKGYLHHHNTRYRAHAAMILVSFIFQSDEVIGWLLERLERERSPRVIYHILYALLHSFRFRKGILVSAETHQAVLKRATLLLCARQPWIRHVSATLIIRILGQKTPEYVTEVMINTWSSLRKTKWPSFDTIDEAFTGHINRLGRERAYNVYLQLMLLAPTYRAVSIVWDSFFYSSLKYWLGWHDVSGSRIAFTPKQYTLMKAILNCRTFWQWKRGAPDKLKQQGLEQTQTMFRQQLKHARLVDRIEASPRARDFPLQLNRGLK